MSARDRRRRGVAVLLTVLRERRRLAGLSPDEWDVLIPAAETAKLLPRLGTEAQRMGLTSTLPDWARDRLTSAHLRGQEFERAVKWEIDRVHRALSPTGIRPAVLKGAAYIGSGLPCGLSRVVADVDILVAEADIPKVEAALRLHGWEFDQLDPYDERYYREWMHELPPMRHRERGTMLDVHHRILPRTGRIHPPTERLLAKTVEVNGTRVLSPEHMVLHSAAHLFQDGEVAGGLRDVMDLHDLLERFGGGSGFWNRLVNEAQALALGRPLFYGVRYAIRTFGTQVPEDACVAMQRWRPRKSVLLLMDALVRAAVIETAGRRASPAAFALYVRSHWLRMPGRLLIRHLLKKATRGRPANIVEPDQPE